MAFSPLILAVGAIVIFQISAIPATICSCSCKKSDTDIEQAVVNDQLKRPLLFLKEVSENYLTKF